MSCRPEVKFVILWWFSREFVSHVREALRFFVVAIDALSISVVRVANLREVERALPSNPLQKALIVRVRHATK